MYLRYRRRGSLRRLNVFNKLQYTSIVLIVVCVAAFFWGIRKKPQRIEYETNNKIVVGQSSGTEWIKQLQEQQPLFVRIIIYHDHDKGMDMKVTENPMLIGRIVNALYAFDLNVS